MPPPCHGASRPRSSAERLDLEARPGETGLWRGSAPMARRPMRVMAPAYPQARLRLADTPAGASRRCPKISWRRRRSWAVVRTNPRRIARHSAWPRPVSRFSRRGGGSPQRWTSLRMWNIAHLRALDGLRMGRADHAALLGGAVVSWGEFFLSTPEGKCEGEAALGCGKLRSCHLMRYFVGRVPRPGSTTSTRLAPINRRRARRVWRSLIPARWARRRAEIVTVSSGAERSKTIKTLEAEGGRQRRIEENWVSVPPSWHLTISLRRATLALAIATPYGRGDAGAPCPHTGPFFASPSAFVLPAPRREVIAITSGANIQL